MNFSNYTFALLTSLILLGGIMYAELLPHRHYYHDGSYDWVRKSFLLKEESGVPVEYIYSWNTKKINYPFAPEQRKILTGVWIGTIASLTATIGAGVGAGISYVRHDKSPSMKITVLLSAVGAGAFGALCALYENPLGFSGFDYTPL